MKTLRAYAASDAAYVDHGFNSAYRLCIEWDEHGWRVTPEVQGMMSAHYGAVASCYRIAPNGAQLDRPGFWRRLLARLT